MTISADAVPSQLRQQSLAALTKALPGDAFVCVGGNDQHQVVALFQVATEDLCALKIDRQPLEFACADALTGPFEVRHEDALARADCAEVLRSDVEHGFRP